MHDVEASIQRNVEVKASESILPFDHKISLSSLDVFDDF